MQQAGTARVREIGEHWRVDPDTVRAIIAAHAVPPVGVGMHRYRWSDIWRLEGISFAAPCDFAELRAPLMLTSELAALDPAGRSARTWRRLLAARRLPSIRLSPRLRRVRRAVFERMVNEL